MRALRRWWLAAVACAWGVPAAAAGPSPLPQPRVVQDMHTAAIEQVRADARFERLVTVGRDKTLRIWRLQDLQWLRTVPLPADPGIEGTPYTVALSADGAWAYVAGYTGHAWHQAAHIYRVDAVGGRIVGTLGRFDGEAVTALDLSPDGRSLAVGLGRGGLAVIDASTGAVRWQDRAYAGPVSFVHHAPDGRIASAAADGCLRVHAPDGTLAYRMEFPPRPDTEVQCTGGDLGGVRFSPDGRWLALGHRARPEVALFEARGLTLFRTVRVEDDAQRSLCCVAWAPDGRRLFINGTVVDEQVTPLYEVDGPAAGVPRRRTATRHVFSNMLPLPDGSLVLATTAPALVRIDGAGDTLRRPDGQAMSVEPDNIDFHRTRASPASWRLSDDGRSAAFEARAGHWLRLSPFASNPAAVLAASAGPPDGFAAASPPGSMTVVANTGQYGHRQPAQVNGHGLPLQRDEGVRSWAVHGTRRIAAVGTTWRLHLVDAQARPLAGWASPPFLPAPAYHTALSGDGRWVVVALGDGTVRWFDVASGRERLAAFVHINGRDWVVWRPDGFYTSSPGGDRYLGWLVNRGEGATPDLLRAEQFERHFYRPDLVRAALQGDAVADQSAHLAAALRDLAPPRVHITSIDPAGSGGATIRFTAESTGRPVREIGVYVDGIPLLPSRERRVTGGAAGVTRTVTVPWQPQPGRVRVEAETDRALGVDETMPARVLAAASGGGRRPTLWLVAAGVHRFDRLADVEPLPTATNDAVVLSDTLADPSGRAFGAVRRTVLIEGSATPPTRGNILASVAALDDMVAPQDTVVVFVASHGASDGTEYYLLAKDSEPADTARLAAAQAAGTHVEPAAVPSLLSASDLAAALRRLPGRRIVILDTCQSGAAGHSDPYTLLKRSASARLAVMSAAQGDEASYDSPNEPHGAFTGALIRALAAPGTRTLRTAFDATGPDVARVIDQLRATARGAPARARIRQTPALVAPPALESTVLSVR